ncbi:type III secretion system stator protein SctL [Trinickia dinghuensis]|uniref:Flagellar assembly protein FliH n=1 Tax=Trinickia dinghuensis TaxID=2291023 RepID=A0A3D8JZM2_9BURK|nr:type III secretion system stator protein SctL [Trinickia dinghuensis]RDU98065.1 HrpE/YscL family type III secretion apparatus protein [Trinickia dinghuensis]
MGLAFLITSENLQMLSERRVLKEHEYSALLDANSIVLTAKKEAERIVADAERRRDEMRRQGYDEGFARGEREGAERAVAATLDTAHALALSRAKMADMVVRGLRELVGEFERERIFELALKRIDAFVRDEAFLVVRVAPDAVDAMKQTVADHRNAMTDEAHAAESALRAQAVRVVADASLGSGDCIVETPAGSIDARLSTQIDAIRSAIGMRRGG